MNVNTKLYFDALFQMFGSAGKAETCLDNISKQLSGNASTVEEAKKEIRKIINK